MQIGLISLVLVQLAFIGASALLYARMRSKADADKASMIPWGIKVEAAMGTAQAAQQKVDVIELQHYKSLRSMFEDQVLQIAQLKATCEGLKREIDALTTKVLSLQRMERGYSKRKAEEVAPAMPGSEDGEGSDLERAVANGEAFPLPYPRGAPQPPKRNSFGKIP